MDEKIEKKWHKDHFDYFDSQSFSGDQRVFEKSTKKRIEVALEMAKNIEKGVYERSNRTDINSAFASLWRLMDKAFELAEKCPRKRDREKEEEKISQAFDAVFTRLERRLLLNINKYIKEEDRETAAKEVRSMFNGAFASIWSKRKIRVLESLEKAKENLDRVYEYAKSEAMKFPEEDRESAIRKVDKEFSKAYEEMSLLFVLKEKKKREE